VKRRRLAIESKHASGLDLTTARPGDGRKETFRTGIGGESRTKSQTEREKRGGGVSREKEKR